MRTRTSKIWTLPEDQFREIVSKSLSIREILLYFELENKGSNYRTLRARIVELKIDDSHIPRGMGHNKGKTFISKNKTPLSEILVESSSFNRSHLKERLIKEFIIKYECSECKNTGLWNNKKLSLQLEHKNGISNDNRLENLCFLCPNCHSQSDTFAGKNNTKIEKKKYFCSCGNTKSCPKSITCISCSKKLKRKVVRPSIEELLFEIKTLGYRATGSKYGVSGNCIKKWIK